MVKSKTLIIGLIILVVIVLAGSYFILNWKSQAPSAPTPSPNNEKEVGMPKATGEADDLVEASLQGILDESSFYNQEDTDINLGLTDVEEVNKFGQAVNENEF